MSIMISQYFQKYTQCPGPLSTKEKYKLKILVKVGILCSK